MICDNVVIIYIFKLKTINAFRKEMGIICSLLLLSLIWAPLGGRGSPRFPGHCPPALPLCSAHLALVHTNQLKVKRHKGLVLLPVALKFIVESTWYFGVGQLYAFMFVALVSGFWAVF